jgi:hypothetical protein
MKRYKLKTLSKVQLIIHYLQSNGDSNFLSKRIYIYIYIYVCIHNTLLNKIQVIPGSSFCFTKFKYPANILKPKFNNPRNKREAEGYLQS